MALNLKIAQAYSIAPALYQIKPTSSSLWLQNSILKINCDKTNSASPSAVSVTGRTGNKHQQTNRLASIVLTDLTGTFWRLEQRFAVLATPGVGTFCLSGQLLSKKYKPILGYSIYQAIILLCISKVSESASESVSQSVSQPVSQSVSKSVRKKSLAEIMFFLK